MSSVFCVVWNIQPAPGVIKTRIEIFSNIEKAKGFEESVRRELCFQTPDSVKIIEYRLDRPGSADLSVEICR